MALKIEQIERALKANGGFIAKTAKSLNVRYQTIWERIRRSPRLKQFYEEIRESYIDLAESKLLVKVREGDLGAICFFLKCQGKKRGYIEKLVVGDDGSYIPKAQPVSVIIQVQDGSKKEKEE